VTQQAEIIAADIGNSSMTLCRMRGLEILQTIDTSSSGSAADMRRALAPLDEFTAWPLVCASVNPRGLAALEAAWQELGGGPATAFGRDVLAPIRNHANPPEGAGQDRLMNAVAARHLYGDNAVVVDFGTAITLDVLRDGAYTGGAIAPGIGLAMQALHQKTALLPLVEIAETRPPVIGTNTEAAITSGVYYGYLGLVERLLAEVLATFPTPPPAVATGGYGVHLAPQIPGIQETRPELTHLGIALAWTTLQ
jgi:type III pantothenate kinase